MSRNSREGSWSAPVFLSSDYVFDGTKTTPYETGDARNPQSVYGRTKAEAEINFWS
jgi:dTDP-4-dehydrorhamnose reductase